MLSCASLGCSSSDHPPLLDPNGAPARPTARIPERGAAFHPMECWVTPPAEYAVDCGTVTTTGHSDGTGGTVELAVAVVYSSGEHVAREPVVFLDGGPGAGSLQGLLTDSIPFSTVLADHDLVLFDQRGTGFSKPKPDCNVDSSIVMSAVGTDGDGDGGVPDATTTHATLPSAVEMCHTSAAASADLSIFRSVENAADAVAVEHALGYTSWNLYGISYGTRYALTVLRDHPQGVKTAVIDSVVPLQVDLIAEQGANVYSALHLIAGACATQSSCAETYGDLEAKELAVLERFDAAPPRVMLSNGKTAVVSAAVVANLLVTFMYSPPTISLLPELVEELTSGDYSALAALASAEGASSPIDLATYLSVTCADETPFSSPAALTAALARVPESWRKWVSPSTPFDNCRIWNVPASPAKENEAVSSAIPTLVTSGQFDPVTPPSYGALAASTLKNSRNVVFAGEAHGSTIDACGSETLHAFLASPTAPTRAGCQSLSSLSFQSLGAATPEPTLYFDTSGRRPSAELIRSAKRRFPFPVPLLR
jgi:pimeloyl-ACP methyl ester carboxylesterase